MPLGEPEFLGHSPSNASISALALLGPAEVVDHLRRKLPVMLLIFFVISAVALGVALKLQPRFEAHTSILIRLGDAYVYQPGVGDAARGATPTNEQIVQSEMEILQSASLKRRVISVIGYERLYPAKARAYDAASPGEKEVLVSGAVHDLDVGLKFATAPDTSVVKVSYANPDPHLTALVLNTLLDEYVVYRRTILAGGEASAVTDQKRALETRLQAADRAYADFLADNHIGDIETEKASLAASYGQLVAEKYSVAAALSEAEGGASEATRLSHDAPREIGLYRDLDHTALDRLNQLRAERQELASRYRPGAQPLVEKDMQIAAIEALAASSDRIAGGARRVGVNPIWQTLESERNSSTTRAASLRSRQAAISRALEELIGRRQSLAVLEPQVLALTREREILTANLRTLAAREEELTDQQGLAGKGDDNIRIVERVSAPVQASSLRGLVLAAGLLFALASALLYGLFGLAARRGYPSQAAAARALGVPIIATAPQIG